MSLLTPNKSLPPSGRGNWLGSQRTPPSGLAAVTSLLAFEWRRA